ncbi:RodZ domain-containing protein [Aliiglaciecola sp. M165]|uniref:RodZ domain-containing protein n=1 Tax=Aliiglaciecola sp. M165 TaxID=2593649 RepID=UPI0011811FD5|nr:RodZ domain-containing protein [Aliiglaciecola sp. M165]TRY30881.1 DUF4115 domain-containing protein [Aliiglaciecola sp. M165]
MSDELQETQTDTQGPGAILKAARERLGLSAADIATKLHLKLVNIEAIEADNYDANISVTFTKGYLKLYAKQVNVTEQTVLDAFASLHVEEKEPAKLQSFSKRVAKQANDDRLMLLTYLIVAVLAAMVVIWWFQQSGSDNETAINRVQTAEEGGLIVPEQQVEAELAPTSDDLIVSAQREAEALNQQGELEPPVTQATSADTSLLNANESALDTETNLEEVEAALPLTVVEREQGQTIELVFEFADNCWMNLTDSTGEAIAYGVKKAGRVMTVSGVAPFEVTLGAPQVVQISYDGVAVDMSGFAAGQTAKFSLPFGQ